ncbi:uncharacterized protein [Chelonus insularis]|uniref:uncharacterized protein n=1 Tax=Chelonus insularis TaxID=460826 RepID=UPI00158EE2F3|nr:uncharacterized protein LOC118066715 [Chelonus insularis]
MNMNTDKPEDKSSKCARGTQSITTPSLNLMEQLLLAKMDRYSVTDSDVDESKSDFKLSKKKPVFLRINSMDSQTSASTFSSVVSSESSKNRYCKCDDCLLGIVDKHQHASPSVGYKKSRRKKEIDNNSLQAMSSLSILCRPI